MHIITAYPPNYEEIKKAFNLDDKKPIYFSYGNVVYNPLGTPLTSDLIRHEETHLEQQSGSREVANLWWQRYLIDPLWRIEQEGEAYGAQYAFICQIVKDRNNRYRNLHELSKFLSGPMYGSVISYKDAMAKILEYAEMGKTPLGTQ